VKDKINYNIPILNLLRAIASISVCFVHLNFATDLHKYPINKILMYGQQGVPIFFVISGFVIPYSLWNIDYNIKNFFTFLKKRLIRIGLPFLIIVIICAIIEPQFNILKLIFNTFYLVPFTNYQWYSGIFWTLGVEFQFYILIGIFFTLIKNSNKYILMCSLLFFGFLGSFITQNQSYWLIVHNFHYFIFGLIILITIKKKISLVEGHVLLFILTIFLCFKIAIVTGLVGYLTAITILHLNFETTITNFLGKISYSLYLTHTLTADLFLSILGNNSINAYLLFVILNLCCLIIAAIFYFIFERIALKWSRNIKVNNLSLL
jgi:peptidoglycan/LPS O-acetylase OafA/YrhL